MILLACSSSDMGSSEWDIGTGNSMDADNVIARAIISPLTLKLRYYSPNCSLVMFTLVFLVVIHAVKVHEG